MHFTFLRKALLECPAASAGLLVRLDLADNTLGEEGAGVLAKALASQPSLTYVNLRDCDLQVNAGVNYGGRMPDDNECLLLLLGERWLAIVCNRELLVFFNDSIAARAL